MPIATSAPGWRIDIPANPARIGAMRTSFAEGAATHAFDALILS
jgi:hypothetical protein